jgi:hypothetical protein
LPLYKCPAGILFWKKCSKRLTSTYTSINLSEMKITRNCITQFFVTAILLFIAHLSYSFTPPHLNNATGRLFSLSELRYGINDTVNQKVELYNAGISAFKAAEYQKSMEYFQVYRKRFPEEIYGYYWCFRNALKLDKNMSKGLAVDDAIKLIQIGERDIKVYKPTLILPCQYLIDYYSKINLDSGEFNYYTEKMKLYDTAGDIKAY